MKRDEMCEALGLVAVLLPAALMIGGALAYIALDLCGETELGRECFRLGVLACMLGYAVVLGLAVLRDAIKNN